MSQGQGVGKRMGRMARLASKMSIGAIRGAFIGTIKGACKLFGPETLGEMIKNNWYVIGGLHYVASGAEIGKKKKLVPEQIEKIRNNQGMVVNTVLPLIEEAKALAIKFPPEEIEKRCSSEWIMEKGEERFPILVKVVKQHKALGRRWLKAQCKEISDYMLGRSIYSPPHEKMITGNDAKEIEEVKKWLQSIAKTRKLEGSDLATIQADIRKLDRLREQALSSHSS